MKARKVHEHLLSLDGGWIDRQSSVDRFIAGDPEAQVRGIAVGWMSYSWALRRAVELDCNLFVTHEPTYIGHHDDEEAIFRFAAVRDKRQWIEDSGLIILRCHDLWDQLPGIGIPDAWAAQLGLDKQLDGEGYFRVYDVRGHTTHSLARHVAERTRRFGQQGVELVGPPEKEVSRLVLGTGAITPLPQMLDRFDADIALCSDDGFVHWHSGALAVELSLPVIIVNHAVSELPGIERLAEHLRVRFPHVPVHHIAQQCTYRLIGEGNPG